jgi:hypothetical protein
MVAGRLERSGTAGTQLNLRLSAEERRALALAAARVGKSLSGWAKTSLLQSAASAGPLPAPSLEVIEARLAWIGSVLQAVVDDRAVARVGDQDRAQAGDALAELRPLLLELSSRRHGIDGGTA